MEKVRMYTIRISYDVAELCTHSYHLELKGSYAIVSLETRSDVWKFFNGLRLEGVIFETVTVPEMTDSNEKVIIDIRDAHAGLLSFDG